ncbi:alpha-galactosidase [Microbacterium sp. P07]|uniref:alpha-galactosidase n=1 Tax=Microbacterium sp. P07 TaxID=3366952 RepID=UPI0037453F61
MPCLLHWGSDLGDLSQDELVSLADALVPAVGPSSIDTPLRLSLLPALADGWSGRPALGLPRSGARAHLLSVRRDGSRLEISSRAGDATITSSLVLTPEGVLLVRHELRNDGSSVLPLTSAGVVLPLPDRTVEVLDFTGRWARERWPQRLRPGHGTWLRESRHGRGGHDDAFLFAAGTPDFGFRSGEVWATHVAWSGDTASWFERTALGRTVIGGGERLGLVELAPGESYTTPTVVGAWSGDGLDGVSDRLHPWVRSWSTIRKARPLTLNTWEAVYFDQSLERLTPLIDRAAEVGVERFVLDDGWFRGRTDDRRALGDWTVDLRTWPDDLTPLIERVRSAGMEFGLWVEPEMVSLDSDLARQHPEWMLTPADGVTWRWQHVLDLSQPAVRAYLFERLDALLTQHPIAFLKWDHNRDLLVEDSHAQVVAVYALIDDLRAAHPGVEIESCASGGARIDLEMLRRTDRVWASDTNDPLERQAVQRWTGVLVPPEYVGSHLGDAHAHTTGRASSLSFRLATALFASAGIEWDLTRATEAELAAVRTWADRYRQYRGLLHSGRTVRADMPEPGVLVHGVVSLDAREAVAAYVVTDGAHAALPPRFVLPGLDPALRYRVEAIDLGAAPLVLQDAPPPWLAEGAVLSGAVLSGVGLPMPLLLPGNALVLSLVAE